MPKARKPSFSEVVAALFDFTNRLSEMHPGDDPIEIQHGHHCCKGDCWHRTLFKSGKPLAEVLKEKRAARNN